MAQQAPLKGLSALENIFNIPSPEVSSSGPCGNHEGCSKRDEKGMLSSISDKVEHAERSLHSLHALLTEAPGPWPTIPLIRCYARLSKLIPEELKSNPDGEVAKLRHTISTIIKGSYESLLDFMCRDSRPALRTTNPNEFITHKGLHDFVATFPLAVSPAGRKLVVAIALTNGPLLAATCIAVTTYHTAAPINPAAGLEQFRADVLNSGAKAILTSSQEYEKLQLRDDWVRHENIEVYIVNWDHGDDIRILDTAGHVLNLGSPRPLPNAPDDIALVLFTSGTSGAKKVVPITLHSIIAGVVFVMDSWGLSPVDTCLNMMPLYHVGGLVRNIFAPVFSGGCTVCCAAFDPNLFWDVVESLAPTWYYASPSMHSVILAQALERPGSLKKSKIRLICNAAGGLLPSLANQIRDTFNCIVLPSYGMTECMPISTPPLQHTYSREGSSGVSAGPELTVLDWSERKVGPGAVGRICVRGEPVFPGYLRPDGSFDKSSFNPDGWFDTGDLGYMDSDGYLYITGRSKEVINRGGEIISPFEVENAIMSASLSPTSPIHGKVGQVMAFSAPHDVLQEVVAVVLVTPPGKTRIDLKRLQSALRSSLQQVKWPALIIYMDDLPKKNNKVLRIKLGQRLGLPEISENTPYLRRHWEATCPAPDTALSVSIACAPCIIDQEAICKSLDAAVSADGRYHMRRGSSGCLPEIFCAPAKLLYPAPSMAFAEDLKERLCGSVHNYMVPETVHVLEEPFPTDDEGQVDDEKLQDMVDRSLGASMDKLTESTEGKVAKVFANMLYCHPAELPRDVEFFNLGGDSLRAGRVTSALRSEFGIQVPINIIFNSGSVQAIAAYVDKNAPARTTSETEDEVIGCTKTNSSTNPFLMAIQLIPLVVFYPLRRAFQWTIFIAALSGMQSWPTNTTVPGRLLNLTLSILLSRIVVRIVLPFAGILAKWTIIGRYREGLYPMWGSYHTRWWMVQKIVSISGKGWFGLNDTTQTWYCKLMGARIGKNVKLAGASLGEWDLLDIRDRAVLSHCICRPFAAEGNTSMYLGKITIGERSSVGVSSIVAAGTEIPSNTCIGPNSSSWELQDADEGNRYLSPDAAPQPHWLLTVFLTSPLRLISWLLSLIPWIGGLVGMVLQQPMVAGTPIRNILDWFTEPRRVAYHYLALSLKTFFSPFIVFAFSVAVKLVLDAVFGELSQTGHGHGAISTWRANVMKSLLPVSRLHDMTALFGYHYEATSIALRMLGSKIGKRVYWPGTGPSIGDYHLLDVGDDVVFGSRAHLITSDGVGSDPITIRDGAMIADRVCLLPGVEVGERTTMGSGSLTGRNKKYEAGSTYVGSKGRDAVCLSAGNHEKHKPRQRIRHLSSDDTLTADRSISKAFTRRERISSEATLAGSKTCLEPFQTGSDTDDDLRVPETISPFGRAFCLKLAPYHVFGPAIIFCYSSFMTIFTAFYWNIPNITSVQLVDHLMNQLIARNNSMLYESGVLFGLCTLVFAILTSLQAVLALCIVIASKWVLLGRRQPGNYDWDKSPYCQRWQLFLSIERLRKHCYRGQGILGLLTGTNWIVLYFRALGAKIGNDCALFANGCPNLMFTEPDLITLGDRVVVDDASVVAHINTRGKFDLNRLEIGNRCVLRTGSRLLSGAKMEEDSCLLEHTLIMGGDTVENKWTMQGWPATKFDGDRT
ncbi:AMP-dependent synthetase/ligase [Metarhizium album ARSEF 1941]|uniref:AMP-dependent synthetase/ligase n=1 Tax=Metarhizium album (strain ARSEF 1941) TaxID=1081103 RepID=A0A0B2WTA4_METAS|nr:AMP-dependent synthetase/ligase [Metarhizium album ARSEF 1941]KHN99276.1 AMP-dependent synthetase/ligase [Metarhizium album ARSEF 1941]